MEKLIKCKERVSRNFDVLNGKSGYYCFIDKNYKVIYVGKSSNLNSRILTHYLYISLGDKFYSDVKYILSTITYDEVIACHYEVCMIETFKPKLNKIIIKYEDWLKTLPTNMKKNIDYIEIKKHCIDFKMSEEEKNKAFDVSLFFGGF